MTTKKADAKTEEEEEDPKGEQTGRDAKDDDKGTGDGSADGGSLEASIRKIVNDVVGPLLGGSGKGGRATALDDEDRLSRLVRDAQVKLKAEEDKENRFKKVEEVVEKLVEKPPARDGVVGKLQRFMWGSE